MTGAGAGEWAAALTAGKYEVEELLQTTPVDVLIAQLAESVKDKALAGAAVEFCAKVLTASTKDYHKHLVILGVTPELLALGDNAKLTKEAAKILKKEIEATPAATVLVHFLPVVLAGIENPAGSKWKNRVLALETLEHLMDRLMEHCPKQLNGSLARIVEVLVVCCKEPRAEIKKSASRSLEKVGQSVKCNEIRNIADKILKCLENFGNVKLATDTLYLIANTTFLSAVDAASFALIYPIVERAMKERSNDSRKNGIMIVGAAVLLIADHDMLTPYLPKLLPLLEGLALDPIFEIQRESAKALGCLGRNLPHLLPERLLPFCADHLAAETGKDGKILHDALNERVGAGHALSEVLVQCGNPKLFEAVLNRVIKTRVLNANAFSGEVQQGGLKLMEFLTKHDAYEQAESFVRTWEWALLAINAKDKVAHDQSLMTCESIVQQFGGTHVGVLLPALAEAMLTFSSTKRVASPSPRVMVMSLFQNLVDKVCEFRAYGTDMMSMTCCSLATRQTLITLLFVMRADETADVRRQANKVISENLQSVSKTKKEMQETMLHTIKALQQSSNPLKNAIAERCLAEQKGAVKELGPFDEEWFANQADANQSALLGGCDFEALQKDVDGVEDPVRFADINTVFSALCAGCSGDEAGADDPGAEYSSETHWPELGVMVGKAVDELIPASDREYFFTEMLTSCVLEALTFDSAFTRAQSFCFGEDLVHKVKQVLKQIYAHYHPKELKMMENPDEILCYVPDLMLIYGGGHELLKNTTLELRKGKRYGVLGRNGTGKTTLMNLLASGGVPGVPDSMTTIHVKPEVLDKQMQTKSLDFMKLENPDVEQAQLEETLEKVMFPKNLWKSTIGELSGGWRMRLLIAGAMMKKADVLLLDEPTNHLDKAAVMWLCDYLNSLGESAIMVISHDPIFLNRVCTNIINYNKGKLVYYEGNFDDFKARMGISEEDADALLSGQVGVGANGIERDAKDSKAGGLPLVGSCGNLSQTTLTEPAASVADELDPSESASPRSRAPPQSSAASHTAASEAGAGPDRKAKIIFPVAGKVKGLTSLAKPVMEVKNLTFSYAAEKGNVIQGVSGRITMASRIHIKGPNGAGKTTFMNMICGEVHPNASALPQEGTVERHRNMRLSYMAQQHMHHMKDFMQTSPFIYIQKRYAQGYDQALQDRLLLPRSADEKQERVERAKKHGRYGNQIKKLISRTMKAGKPQYEAEWENLPDSKQNTWVTLDDLANLACETYALAYDARQAAQDGGIADRPLSQREIVKHLEQFGITEELALNRNIGMFSAGQKSKVSLAASFWIKPHVVALDEPTNYIDMETLDALVVALQRFKGGVICISHSQEFVDRVCSEVWEMKEGKLHITKKDK